MKVKLQFEEWLITDDSNINTDNLPGKNSNSVLTIIREVNQKFCKMQQNFAIKSLMLLLILAVQVLWLLWDKIITYYKVFSKFYL